MTRPRLEFQKRLLKLVKKKDVSVDIYGVTRALGSVIPKINAHSFSVGLNQYNLSKLLSNVLQRLLEIYSVHCIKDSLTFLLLSKLFL